MTARLVSSWLLLLLLPHQKELVQKKDELSSPPFIERSQKQFSFYPGGRVEIYAGVPGKVKVIGWQRASVMIEIERTIWGLGEEEAIALATQFPVKLRWTQTVGTVRTLGPPPGGPNTAIDLTLYVPKDRTDMKIQILKGDLAVGAVNGWVEATLQEGALEAKSVSGYYSLSTRMGDVNVELSGRRFDGYGFTAVTQKGNVELHLPSEYSAALQLDTKAGEIIVDYPEQLVDGESVPLEATAKQAARSLMATVGAGGAPIRLLTVAGNVGLKKIEPPRPNAP